ncbi:MAG: DUF1501 domain-containing protein [Phycisphaerae bacterium]
MLRESFYTSRREFLTESLTFLSAASTLPLFLGNTATALGQDSRPGGRKPEERILVVVQLAGGNDGLNMIVPCEMDEYYRARPRLAVQKKDALKLAEGVGLHPSAKGLKELFDEGHMAVVQGVGYPNPDRSHFTSMDIWHTADRDLKQHSGWLGRYFDACCKGNDPEPEPIEGIALMGEAPMAMQGQRFTPLAFENPDSLAWRAPRRDAAAEEVFKKLNNISGDIPTQGKEIEQFLQRAALKAQVGAEQIRSAAGASLRGRRGGLFQQGGQLGGQLQMVARLILAGLPTRIYYVSMGGFDTHTAQQARQQRLMEELGNAMNAFIDSLAEHKLLDRVLVMTFSEFGRRVQENASGGTDHGEAAPMMFFGGQVRAGVHEKHPSLSELHRGDLPFNIDFRRVYSSVLRDWLGAKPEKILGNAFPPLKLVKNA